MPDPTPMGFRSIVAIKIFGNPVLLYVRDTMAIPEGLHDAKHSWLCEKLWHFRELFPTCVTLLKRFQLREAGVR